jgi:small subunit ribosomal protein S7
MPRKARSFNRHFVYVDPKHSNVKYGKFINYLMERGKKMVAQKIFYGAIDEVEKKLAANQNSATAAAGEEKKLTGIQVFEIALKNVSPLVEIKGRRIGGANYQVPIEVVEPRKTTLGMRWLIAAARGRKGIPMHLKLAAEIMDAYNKIGAAIKKREDTHKMAEANKAFAHFAKFNRR